MVIEIIKFKIKKSTNLEEMWTMDQILGKPTGKVDVKESERTRESNRNNPENSSRMVS